METRSATTAAAHQEDANGAALRRKRERDKDNQRKKRQREKEYTTSLEQRIAELERRLQERPPRDDRPATEFDGDSAFQIQAVSQPRTERQDLEQRLDQLLNIIESWGTPGRAMNHETSHLSRHSTNSYHAMEPQNAPVCINAGLSARAPSVFSIEAQVTPPMVTATTPRSPMDARSISSQVLQLSGGALGTSEIPHDPWSCKDPTPFDSRGADSLPSPESQINSHPGARLSRPAKDILISASSLNTLLMTAGWMRLPLNTPPWPSGIARGDVFGPVLAELRASPEQFATCDAEPKVLDIMFGGSSNTLANVVAGEVAKEPSLPPERFAAGWLLYLFLRWQAYPSEESFSRIPDHFRPTVLQFVHPHSPSVDLILWPQMRENFIKYGPKYDREEVFGLLACTCRIKGGFNRNFIVRQNNGDPQVDPNFYAKFMSLEGWGILEQFWTEYPELVEGLDRETILTRQEHLMPD